MNYKLVLAYNGTNYYGWAIQPNLRTIQGSIIDIIKRIFKIDHFAINASGRTDKGVHAINQVINIKHKDLKINPNDLMHAINSQLDYDIVVKSCEWVDDNFHARFSCIDKTYCYVINTNEIFNVFEHNIVYQYNKAIDLNKLNKVKSLLIGKHNFLSFSTSEYNSNDCIRDIKHIEFILKDNLVIIKINANGFLRSMVRMIVGLLLAYNENLIDLDFVLECLNNPLKGSVKFKAPACGLYLYEVNYIV